MRQHRPLTLLSLITLGAGACSGSAPAPALDQGQPPAAASVDEKPTAAAAPPAPASAVTAAAAVTAAPAPPTSASSTPEAPNVVVTNIGMHIGGGPNDAATKAPIAESVEPHFEDFRRCFAHAEDPHKGGDFGVDLQIEKAGGPAKASHPRTGIKGEGFESCVMEVFQKIDFRKPKGGKTVVSYSLRFSPGK